MVTIDKDTYKWFKKLFNNIGIGILIINKKREIIEANEYACQMFGYEYDELMNKNASILHTSPSKYEEFAQQIFKKVITKEPTKCEWIFKKKDNTKFWSIVSGNFIDGKNEVLWTFIDITKNKIIETKLKEKIAIIKELSITDELTKLYNRRHFNRKFSEEINRARRDNKKFFLSIIDIDNFKKYNDTYGHQKGDEAIQKVAKVLLNYTKRASDFAFRTGGDEFAIIATMQDDENFIRYYFENIKKHIEDLNITHTLNQPYQTITVSIGVIRVSNYNNLDEKFIYQLADEELYIAKKNGRNRVEIKFKTI